jgi:hypothetical protein
MGDPAFSDHFDGSALDESVWVPHYLPMWSSRAETRADHTVADSELRLRIAPALGLWCAGDHEPPLRVSGIQSGIFSGEVGSTIGQQPFKDGLLVREAQPTHWGWTPRYGRIEVRARMTLGRSSMAAVWLSGLEQHPSESGEICIFEIFGNSLRRHSAAVGVGLKPFRDPKLTRAFAAPRVPIDVGEFHVYAADWKPDGIEFLVDGGLVETVRQSPAYPMQMMVAVFDFPDDAGAAPDHVPELRLDYVRGGA